MLLLRVKNYIKSISLILVPDRADADIATAFTGDVDAVAKTNIRHQIHHHELLTSCATCRMQGQG